MNPFNLQVNEIRFERNHIIKSLIENYIGDCYDDEGRTEIIDDYIWNSATIYDTDEMIWNHISTRGSGYISAMYLVFPKIRVFNREMKKLIDECRKAFLSR